MTILDHLALNRFISVVGATLWSYDYLLTCSDEVTWIWPRKCSLAKALYMLVSHMSYRIAQNNVLQNRYVAVPYIALIMFGESCPP